MLRAQLNSRRATERLITKITPSLPAPPGTATEITVSEMTAVESSLSV